MGDSTNSLPQSVKVSARRTLTSREYVARLSIHDHYEKQICARAHMGFRNYDEVRQAIEALKSILPVIERLGGIADDEEIGRTEP